MPRSKKLNKQEQFLKDEWDKIMLKHTTHTAFSGKYKIRRKASSSKLPTETSGVKLDTTVRRFSSKVTPGHSTALKPVQTYTGEKMIGIATMHKSNLIPIFSHEQAVETSQMRRN
jgi:hypothetical protein